MLSVCSCATARHLQKIPFWSPSCNFATAHLTACILFFVSLLAVRRTKWRTLSAQPKKQDLLPKRAPLPEDYCKEDPCNFPWDGELARNWPRVDQLLSNSVHQILPWRFRTVCLLSYQERVQNPVGWKFQRRRDDNKNKIFAFEGEGVLGAERKIVQKRLFSWEASRQ